MRSTFFLSIGFERQLHSGNTLSHHHTRVGLRRGLMSIIKELLVFKTMQSLDSYDLRMCGGMLRFDLFLRGDATQTLCEAEYLSTHARTLSPLTHVSPL